MPLVIEYSEGGVENIHVLGRVQTITIDWDAVDSSDYDFDSVYTQLQEIRDRSKGDKDRTYLNRVMKRIAAQVWGEGHEDPDDY